MPRLVLKVDVDTLRGTREGVPRLLRLLEKEDAAATFLFSLGPDHTGWALRRVFRRGFLAKTRRTSVLKHYGLRTLLNGVLLPAPDIGLEMAAVMKSVQGAQLEAGIHAWDHVLWQDNVRHRDAAWTRTQMRRAYDRFVDIFGRRPATHGAAGWQTNAAALLQIDAWGMRYASDGRGAGPFVPRIDADTIGQHVQLPTTLPTLDELIGADDIDEGNVAAALLARTETPADHVFTLHAELEGGRLESVLKALLRGWRAQGYRFSTLAGLFEALDRKALPVQQIRWGRVPGRTGELYVA